jgi:ATP phosphoribosyltransferase
MEKLKLAIQKSGRLSEKSLELLNECGITLPGGNGKLMAYSPDFPIEILFLRDDDIPQYVTDGIVDAGIAGENIIREKGKPSEIIEKLGFARCHLSLAIPKNTNYSGIRWFNNKRIATTYPKILSKYLKANNIQAEIHEISGSVEIAPAMGLAEGIFDIVSSGSTLFSNNLKEVETVMDSEAVLIAYRKLSENKRDILDSLIFRFQSVQKAKKNKYILLNAPNEKLADIIKLLPGIKSPSILPLADKGWSSVHSVIAEKDFWLVIDKLKANGAEGILVLPIEKMIG